MIRRFGLAISATVALVALAALGVYALRNPERETLDAAVRTAAGLPGEFIGSPVGTTYYEVAGPDTGRVATAPFDGSAEVWPVFRDCPRDPRVPSPPTTLEVAAPTRPGSRRSGP